MFVSRAPESAQECGMDLLPEGTREEIAAWQHDRNANHTKANWHFSTSNARIKLKHLYPSI